MKHLSKLLGQEKIRIWEGKEDFLAEISAKKYPYLKNFTI